ncbi:MAG TPA: hypothetical protein VL053_04630 [Arachidicoccus sp.]|nr:hypothetical protein [Arachidicoccus sp.]
MKVICKYNDPSNLPSGIPDNFDYGLEINKEYLVTGILTFKQSDDLYFLVDESGRPSWFPFQIFEIINNKLPKIWFIKINVRNDYVDYKNLIGFNELCNNDAFFNQLLERDEEAMQVYFKRKIELEKELAE